MNTVSARRYGISDDEIAALDDYEHGPFDEREKAAIRLATIMSWREPTGTVDDDLLAQLQEYFSDGEIMELAMVCAVLTGMAKLLFAFDLADKEAPCPFNAPDGS